MVYLKYLKGFTHLFILHKNFNRILTTGFEIPKRVKPPVKLTTERFNQRAAFYYNVFSSC